MTPPFLGLSNQPACAADDCGSSEDARNDTKHGRCGIGAMVFLREPLAWCRRLERTHGNTYIQ
jgi:hypothetical protein